MDVSVDGQLHRGTTPHRSNPSWLKQGTNGGGSAWSHTSPSASRSLFWFQHPQRAHSQLRYITSWRTDIPHCKAQTISPPQRTNRVHSEYPCVVICPPEEYCVSGLGVGGEVTCVVLGATHVPMLPKRARSENINRVVLQWLGDIVECGFLGRPRCPLPVWEFGLLDLRFLDGRVLLS